jgi:hypothetical protein
MTKPLIETTPEGTALIENAAGDGHTVVQEVGSAPADATDGGQASPQAAPDSPPDISQAEARQLVEKAHKALGVARVTVKLLQQKQLDTRAALALAIQAWSVNGDPMTSEQRQAREHRNYLASEQARKQALFDAGVRSPKMNTSHHQAIDPVTGRQGFKGNSRGAYPRTFQNRSVKDVSMFQKKPAVKA